MYVDGMNDYSYVGNMPVEYVDPMGNIKVNGPNMKGTGGAGDFFNKQSQAIKKLAERILCALNPKYCKGKGGKGCFDDANSEDLLNLDVKGMLGKGVIDLGNSVQNYNQDFLDFYGSVLPNNAYVNNWLAGVAAINESHPYLAFLAELGATVGIVAATGTAIYAGGMLYGAAVEGGTALGTMIVNTFWYVPRLVPVAVW